VVFFPQPCAFSIFPVPGRMVGKPAGHYPSTKFSLAFATKRPPRCRVVGGLSSSQFVVFFPYCFFFHLSGVSQFLRLIQFLSPRACLRCFRRRSFPLVFFFFLTFFRGPLQACALNVAPRPHFFPFFFFFRFQSICSSYPRSLLRSQ